MKSAFPGKLDICLKCKHVRLQMYDNNFCTNDKIYKKKFNKTIAKFEKTIKIDRNIFTEHNCKAFQMDFITKMKNIVISVRRWYYKRKYPELFI